MTTQPCRLIVILDATLDTRNFTALAAFIEASPALPHTTFLAGLTRQATLPLSRFWPQTFYNAHEFLDYRQHILVCTQQFPDIWYLQAGNFTHHHATPLGFTPNAEPQPVAA